MTSSSQHHCYDDTNYVYYEKLEGKRWSVVFRNCVQEVSRVAVQQTLHCWMESAFMCRV